MKELKRIGWFTLTEITNNGCEVEANGARADITRKTLDYKRLVPGGIVLPSERPLVAWRNVILLFCDPLCPLRPDDVKAIGELLFRTGERVRKMCFPAIPASVIVNVYQDPRTLARFVSKVESMEVSFVGHELVCA